MGFRTNRVVWKVILMGLLEGGGRVGCEGSGKQRKLARFERLAECLSGQELGEGLFLARSVCN